MKPTRFVTLISLWPKANEPAKLNLTIALNDWLFPDKVVACVLRGLKGTLPWYWWWGGYRLYIYIYKTQSLSLRKVDKPTTALNWIKINMKISLFWWPVYPRLKWTIKDAANKGSPTFPYVFVPPVISSNPSLTQISATKIYRWAKLSGGRANTPANIKS